MRINSHRIRSCAQRSLLVGLCLAVAPDARAELTLLERDGFKLFTEGRINTFASLGFGDDFPTPNPNPNGGPPHSVVGETALGAAGQNTDQDDAKNKYLAVRGRNGFLGTILALGVRKNITEQTTAKAYIALWGHAEAFNRDRRQASDFDVREGYVGFEGPWGNLTAGRALGLFGRMSTQINFTYGHNFGLGYPCGDSQGPTCGHIGTGVMFPGFAAGFQYTTPSLAGLQVHAGVYDPVRLLGAWNRAPIARPELALSFEQKPSESMFIKLQVEGMVQPVSRLETSSTNPGEQIQHDDKVWGVAGGARFEVGPLRVGAAAFRGKGLGQYYALQNSPVVFNPFSYEIRSFTGMYAQLALVLGKVQLAAGAGRVTIDQLEDDKTAAEISNAKSQTGISAAVYYHLFESLALGLDYFRFQTDWYGAPNSTTDAATGATVILPGVIAPERQVVNYINAGATYHW